MKNHPWFAEVTWDRLARKDIDAPYIPPVKGGQGDASQFDMYPEETEAYGAEGDDPYVSSLLSLISLLDTIPAYLPTCLPPCFDFSPFRRRRTKERIRPHC